MMIDRGCACDVAVASAHIINTMTVRTEEDTSSGGVAGVAGVGVPHTQS